MNEIRWGIIGCGDVTEKKSGPALQKVDGSKLVAVMRRDASKAADYARRHGVPKWYDDADNLIHDPDVTAVYVATPPDTHCEYALRVAAARKPCYVEKPMARNATECRRMIEAFSLRGLPLFVAYYRRRLPAFVKAKELLDGGAIGRLTSIVYRHCGPRHRRADGWRVDVAIAGGGLFLDLASHALDALDYITGPMIDVRGLAGNLATDITAEDVVGMSWRSADSGAIGVATWNFATDAQADDIELLGTDGAIRWRCFGDGTVTLTRGQSTETFACGNPEHVQQPLIQTIVDQLLGRGGVCPSTGESALRTSVVMDQVLAAYYNGRDDDFWRRPGTWCKPVRPGTPAP